MVDIPDMGKSQVAAQAKGPPAEHVRRVFERYVELFSAGEADAIAALFAEDAVVRDPVTAPAATGRENIRDWFQSAFDSVRGSMHMELEGAVRIAGHFAAAAMVVRAPDHGDGFLVETLDVMRFNADGLIATMDAYFGETNYHALPGGQGQSGAGG